MITSQTHPHTVDPRHVTAGEKVIVNMHNAGLMSPDSTNNGRQHVQAWRAPLPQQQGYHRWRFTHTGDGCFTVQNVSSGRHLEPRRRDENEGVYDDIKPGTWVWLESGSPHGARQEWSLIPFGDLYMFVLKDTAYAIGLRDLGNHDSHLDLYDAHCTSRNLWWITDAS
ncbi:hypothetical protein [Nonomuraea dietziae]|uniref:hypothetical protein n=1 Tax=Nonomuraea dietziae TaxID=65515 RepID=UPI0033D960C1